MVISTRFVLCRHDMKKVMQRGGYSAKHNDLDTELNDSLLTSAIFSSRLASMFGNRGPLAKRSDRVRSEVSIHAVLIAKWEDVRRLGHGGFNELLLTATTIQKKLLG